MLPVPLGEIIPDKRVRPLNAFIHSLSNIMQQPCTFGKVDVEPELGCHQTRKVGYFDTVCEQVLAVAGPVLHLPDMLH